ncbi:MAG: DUF1887 family CARF protein, partial [Bacteroidota bacterium]
MPTTLVSLVSQQPLPNIFLIKEMKDVDHYLFITTELMERSGQLEHTIKVLCLLPEQYHRIIVKEDSLKDITNQLQALKLKMLDQHFIVNLTNGTKIMSIATYNFFQDALMSREIYYLPIGKNHYQQIIPPTNDPIKPIQFKIGVKAYFNAYGIEIKNEKFINQVQSKKVTSALYKSYTSNSLFRDSEQYAKGILQ